MSHKGLENSCLVCATLIFLVLGCGEPNRSTQKGEGIDAYSEKVDLGSPQGAVDAWYRAWNTADKKLLDRVMLNGAPRSISFNNDALKYEIASVEKLEGDFDQSKHTGAKQGDVVVITSEYVASMDSVSKQKYFLLREEGGEWKVEGFSLMRDENAPPLPEEIY